MFFSRETFCASNERENKRERENIFFLGVAAYTKKVFFVYGRSAIPNATIFLKATKLEVGRTFLRVAGICCLTKKKYAGNGQSIN